jgi:PAS domain-containing protein
VRSVEWDPSAETLTGSVVGNGALYDTAAFFVGGGGGALAFEDGECPCPVGYNCKHVAAIVIAATDARSGARLGRAARTGATAARPAPSWETSLGALIDPPPAQTAGSPLAIELALRANGVAGRGAPRLLARLSAAVMDTMVEGLYVLDGDGRLTLMNSAASQILGWSEQELLGKRVHAAIHFQHADGSPHPEADCALLKVRTGSGRSHGS